MLLIAIRPLSLQNAILCAGMHMLWLPFLQLQLVPYFNHILRMCTCNQVKIKHLLSIPLNTDTVGVLKRNRSPIKVLYTLYTEVC